MTNTAHAGSDPRYELADPRLAALGMSDSELLGIAARRPGEMKEQIFRKVQTDFS